MRWGIVGTGAIASHFASACAAMADTTCVAVASRSEKSGAAFARKFSIAKAVVGAKALAALNDVDAIYIATPNNSHLSDALTVIEAGIPVLCEKPLSLDLAGAQRIADAARNANVFCMEGLWSLCMPVYRSALERVSSGEIGQLREVIGSFGVPQSAKSMPRLFDLASGGGALLDRGVYLIALAQLFLGPLRLTHASGDTSKEGVDVSVTLILENEEGSKALLSTSLDRYSDNQLTLAGTHGRCHFSEPITCPPSFQILKRDPEAAFSGMSKAPNAIDAIKAKLRYNPHANKIKRLTQKGERWFEGGLQYEIAEVERCIAKGLTESPLVPLKSSLSVLRIIEQARKQLAKTARERNN